MFSPRPSDIDRSTGAWRPLTGLAIAVTLAVTLMVPAPDLLMVSRLLGDGWSSDVASAAVAAAWVLACLGAVLVAEARPRAGLVVATLVAAVVVGLGDTTPVTVFVVLGGVVVVAAWRDPVASALAALAGVAGALVWAATGRLLDLPLGQDTGAPGEGRWGTAVLVSGALVALLVLVRSQREQQRLWLDRTVVEAREGRVAEREGVVAERARLARDLHDVVAHHVSLIAVRAETAPYTHPDLEPAARAVLADVATDARLALDELRGVLGILGRSQDDDRSPQPGWAEVQALVERTRGAGVEVELTGDLAAPVPPSVGYVAYRVVQEALTNARRHAAGQPVSVTMGADPGGAAVAVRNTVTSAAVGSNPSGRGLAGMRERVEGLGGRLVAGPRDGEFVVEAVFGVSA